MAEPTAPSVVPIDGPRPQEKIVIVLPELKEDAVLGKWEMAHAMAFSMINRRDHPGFVRNIM